MLLSIISGCRYIFVAFSTKLYYNIESWLSIPGAAAFYGVITLFGYSFIVYVISIWNFNHWIFFSFIVMYIILPETEGRSLEDIELHYSDNSKGLTDIHILKNRNQVNEISWWIKKNSTSFYTVKIHNKIDSQCRIQKK